MTKNKNFNSNKMTEISLLIIENERTMKQANADYYKFINHCGRLIRKLFLLEAEIKDEYFEKKSFETLLIQNNDLYCELYGENYLKSYANPAYCVKIFGENYGQAVSFFYTYVRSLIRCVFLGRKDDMNEVAGILIEFFEYIKKNIKKLEYSKIQKIFVKLAFEKACAKKLRDFSERFDPDYKFYKNVIIPAMENVIKKNFRPDFEVEFKDDAKCDLRYLFRYGCHISMNEIKMANFINAMPEDKVRKLAEHIVKAYLDGFETENKDRSGRNNVRLIYCAGYEKIVYYVVKELKNRKMTALINLVTTTPASRQYEYDHRFDEKLFLSQDYIKDNMQACEKAFVKLKNSVSKYNGQIRIGKFGEEPFSPENKKECLKLNKKEQELSKKYDQEFMKIYSKNVPDKNTSFSLISFPSPEIGPDYEEIFAEILKINTLDTENYLKIQQKIIDALDRADYVRVKGAAGNKTDISVKLHKLADPKKQTNFYNCGADVNIPVGEVFTSPLLKGTNGTLHINETYLDGFKYIDLVLKFKDGVISDYSCKNFNVEEENRKYIEENLFSMQTGLPLGEFAIGTNTFAYVVAQKYDILKKLPVLIGEKMGPHFAIGDTCYMFVEDIPIYNPLNKKEITARENERTALRKKNIDKAYTNVHVDITLPYESIGVIEACAAGAVPVKIIENGRFILKGTEKLNEPFNI
ncbi:MAG: aminopeptidase [Candidatus Wallbacteria bacterium]